MFRFLVNEGFLENCLISIVESYLSPPHKIDFTHSYDQFMCSQLDCQPYQGELYQQIIEIDKHFRFVGLNDFFMRSGLADKMYCINCLLKMGEDNCDGPFYYCNKSNHSYCLQCMKKLNYKTNQNYILLNPCIGCWYYDNYIFKNRHSKN